MVMNLVNFADPLSARRVVHSVEDQDADNNNNCVDDGRNQNQIIDFEGVGVLLARSSWILNLESDILEPGLRGDRKADEYFK